jgi:hypothetical protein
MPDRTHTPDTQPDLVQIVGVRHLYASEPSEDAVWQEGLIKQVTKGEPQEVREMEARTMSAGFDVVSDFRVVISGRHPADSEDREQ